MNAVYAADHKFIAKCGISLTSLVRNNPVSDLRVYILDFGLTEDDRSLLRKVKPDLIFRDTRHALEEMGAGEKGLQFNTGNFSPVVLVRLLLAEYLDPDVESALYLDSDTIVNGNLFELELQFPLSSDYLLGAVPELYMPEFRKQDLGLEKNDIYYNAGVLWVNLKEWRKEKLSQIFFSYYQERRGRLLYNDQDIINHCCRGRILTLPQRYNMNPNLPYFPYWYIRRIQPAYCTYIPGLSHAEQQDFSASSAAGSRAVKTDNSSEKDGLCITETAPAGAPFVKKRRAYYQNQIRNPLIVHYMGDERPWLEGNHNYYRALYEAYQKESLWKSEEKEPANQAYLAGYHVLNCMTRIFPHFRKLFTDLIGINIYKWKKKN